MNKSKQYILLLSVLFFLSYSIGCFCPLAISVSFILISYYTYDMHGTQTQRNNTNNGMSTGAACLCMCACIHLYECVYVSVRHIFVYESVNRHFYIWFDVYCVLVAVNVIIRHICMLVHVCVCEFRCLEILLRYKDWTLWYIHTICPFSIQTIHIHILIENFNSMSYHL